MCVLWCSVTGVRSNSIEGYDSKKLKGLKFAALH